MGLDLRRPNWPGYPAGIQNTALTPKPPFDKVASGGYLVTHALRWP